MRLEIRSAADFLSDLLRLGKTMNEEQLELFRHNFESVLRNHFQHHWFPDHPTKGSGYRCLRVNHQMDPLIAKAARSVGIDDASLLRSMFPNELTMWIDPKEVSYRIGENGSICVLYDGNLMTTTTAMQNHHHHHHNNSNNNNNFVNTAAITSCKESVRDFDNLIFGARNMNREQFVSS